MSICKPWLILVANAKGCVGWQDLDPEECEPEERDIEAENELISGVPGDPLAAYDVDVREEGQAIQEYLDKIAQLQGLNE